MLGRFLPYRDEALRAVALVATRGEPLAPGLARLAASDRLLGAWARRLVRAAERSARAGAAGAGTVLRRAGLLAADEAAFVDEAERGGDAGAALRVLAAGGPERVPGLFVVEWFPVLLLLALLLPLLVIRVFFLALVLLTRNSVDLLRLLESHDNILLVVGRVPLPLLLFVSLFLVGCLVAMLVVLGRLSGYWSLLRYAWYPEVRRDLCLLDILRRARVGLGAGTAGDGAPRADRASGGDRMCRDWYHLNYPLQAPEIQTALSLGPLRPVPMLERLEILPAVDPEDLAWDRLVRATRGRLERAVAIRSGFCQCVLAIGFYAVLFGLPCHFVVDLINWLG